MRTFIRHSGVWKSSNTDKYYYPRFSIFCYDFFTCPKSGLDIVTLRIKQLPSFSSCNVQGKYLLLWILKVQMTYLMQVTSFTILCAMRWSRSHRDRVINFNIICVRSKSSVRGTSTTEMLYRPIYRDRKVCHSWRSKECRDITYIELHCSLNFLSDNWGRFWVEWVLHKDTFQMTKVWLRHLTEIHIMVRFSHFKSFNESTNNVWPTTLQQHW